jgi:hypothetical protein
MSIGDWETKLKVFSTSEVDVSEATSRSSIYSRKLPVLTGNETVWTFELLQRIELLSSNPKLVGALTSRNTMGYLYFTYFTLLYD